ncbi:MAG: aconitate hydratase [Bacteroidales bacterium]|nr:aconitate hydratase [Bacteroidales bacterium]MBN2632335.1 aconitate hydratase [Bacteroidales bacterium]
MNHDDEMIRKHYEMLPARIARIRKEIGRPLTLSEKILFSHMHPDYGDANEIKTGDGYTGFIPDRIGMQDATAQMALLQFMLAGMDTSRVPVSIHCDHLITAREGAEKDLDTAIVQNREIYDFLRTAAARYDLDFWEPGTGIIHQVVFENYAFPGGLMIGTDSHTPNAGGLGMLAIGTGGADAVDAMTGMPWELRWPLITGVRLTGRLNGWTSPKDLILKLTGMLTVKGGTGHIIEYFGEGCTSLSATGKATICNMGAETGATCSVFGFDDSMKAYLEATGRADIAGMAEAAGEHLAADPEVLENPEKYFDRVLEIDLTTLEPYINGPFSPDRAVPVSEIKKEMEEKGWPDRISAGLLGSCTNSSYEDLSRSASVLRFVLENNIPVLSELKISPGSEKIRELAEKGGFMDVFRSAGAMIFANACGPCIGQWDRKNSGNDAINTIIHSFNRNFSKRADGNPNTHAFVASPVIVAALTVAGRLSFNPLTDELENRDGNRYCLPEPQGHELPATGFNIVRTKKNKTQNTVSSEIRIDPSSQRLQLLEPFPPWDGGDFHRLRLLIKAAGKCTTDHISMAGIWLKYRGHLENISANYMMGAVNFFTGLPGTALNPDTGEYSDVHELAKYFRQQGSGSVVAGGENFGEGSSREHAAMEPRFLGVRAIIAVSFARIHETNLKKQGLLALTFADSSDYERIREDDRIDITGMKEFSPGGPISVMLFHSDGTSEGFQATHSYNRTQIEWFRAGSALNLIRKKKK